MAQAKNSWLGCGYRRLRSLRGAEAAARIPARLLCRAATRSRTCVEQGIATYQQKYRLQQRRRLERWARELAMTVVSASSAT